ncbi:MAG: hypothetical protein methR_P1802 [Methyloprofundus sp.]|nr:MAG: hypothetical protein methR_P1802 [Methyloprofundus sp.]
MKKILLSYVLLFSMLSQLAFAAHNSHNQLPVDIIRNTLALTFAENGTLWRLLPTRDFIYVDFSTDNGNSYSKPSKVNKQAQKISAWPENPPAIAVTKSGRILVLYYADTQQKSTSYFSYSDDLGKTFSTPTLISDHATTDMHYMDKMLVDQQGDVHFFWHDRRNEGQNTGMGSGVLSLYHAKINKLNNDISKNELINHFVCSCCRTAISLSPQGYPIILMRMAFPDGARDHVLLSKESATQWRTPSRISDDHWVIDACPEHGPALAIDTQGRSHLTWFSLSNKRQGIFYAYTDDYGITVSNPMPLGQLDYLPSHPDIAVAKQRVVVAWTEFDGKTTSLYIQQSFNKGESWQTAQKVASSTSSTGYPILLAQNEKIFISWVTKATGHSLIEVIK